MALAESDYDGRLALAESVCDGRMALVMQEKGLASGELGTHVGVLALGAREGEKKDHLGCLACKRRLEKWA